MRRSTPKEEKVVSPMRRFLFILIVAAILIFLLGTFVVQIYRIPTSSMEDTLLAGDWVVVNKFIYRFRSPKPGDITVLKYPINPSKTIIKRCMATEGQTVEIINKVVYVDGQMVLEPEKVKFADKYIRPVAYSSRDNFGPRQVPIDGLFLLGDNRDNSEDSREFGYVDKDQVKGKVGFVLFSWAPDPRAPKFRSPYIIPLFEIFFYNLFHFPDRVRWNRILSGVE